MSEGVPEDVCSLGGQTAHGEALGLFRMLNFHGNTVESLRERIAVHQRLNERSRPSPRAHPEEAYSVEHNLKFRLAVAQEFERLVREGVPIADLPEVEESELDATEETFAVAQA